VGRLLQLGPASSLELRPRRRPRRTGRKIYAINPLSVARYRERHSVARAKSDRVDAELSANILRTDRNAHRPLPPDSELAQAIGVLTRAQQDAVWNRQHIVNQRRSVWTLTLPRLARAFRVGPPSRRSPFLHRRSETGAVRSGREPCAGGARRPKLPSARLAETVS
jgi:transposase